MTQNRNKMLDLFIGNLSNAIVHKILEKSIENPEISKSYFKEVKNSWDAAKKYRDKINPTSSSLPNEEGEYVKIRTMNKTKAELKSRISKGYQNINLDLVDIFIEEALKELKCI